MPRSVPRPAVVVIVSLVTFPVPLFVTSCDEAPSGPVATGTWGGVGVRLEVTPGGAALEFDCASGTWHDRPSLEAGEFTAAGTFSPEKGGPIAEDDPPPPEWTAAYEGTVEGERMRLEVRVPSQSLAIGPMELTRGAPGELRKCLRS
ncbi:MAG: hypothetical protein R6X22_01840 [Gemmatimonadota bacterium]